MTDLARALVEAAAGRISEALHDETGGCHCDPAFTERGRQDPGCVYCQAGGSGLGTEAARRAVSAVLLRLDDEVMRRLLAGAEPVDLAAVASAVRGVGSAGETP